MKKQYNFNFDLLTKGSLITESQLEEILGLSASNEDFWKELMMLRRAIVNHFRRKGCLLRVIERRGDLIILTDEEASSYSFWRWKISLKGASMNETFLQGVNVNNLSHEQKVVHIRRIEVASKVMQAVTQSVRVLPQDLKALKPALPEFQVRSRVII